MTSAAVSPAAVTLIDFDPSSDVTGNNFSAPVDVDSVGGVDRTNFNLTTPFFSSNVTPPVYGAWEVARLDGGAGGQPAAVIRARQADDLLGIQSNSGGSAANVSFVSLFLAEDFTPGTPSYGFDSTSALNLNISAWSTQGTTVQDAEIRFLVLEDGQYYVSEAAVTRTGNVSTFSDSLALTDFNNNATVGKRWAPISLSATDFDIPDTLTFQSVDFQNVEAVGFIGEGGSTNLRDYTISGFSATGTAIPEPTTAGLILMGIGGWLIGKRRGRSR